MQATWTGPLRPGLKSTFFGMGKGKVWQQHGYINITTRVYYEAASVRGTIVVAKKGSLRREEAWRAGTPGVII